MYMYNAAAFELEAALRKRTLEPHVNPTFNPTLLLGATLLFLAATKRISSSSVFVLMPLVLASHQKKPNFTGYLMAPMEQLVPQW